jgi:NADPH:quinone reductase-like Zn-dependent oxidoreductase
MKAFVLRGFGSADRLELGEMTTPSPAGDEVVVRVRATSVNPYDWHYMRGEPRIARLMSGGLGLRQPNVSVLGADVAGEVEAVGDGVRGYKPGDKVFGLLTGGGFAEWASAPIDRIAPMPANLSFEQAAAVPLAGVTALIAIRDGSVQSGQRVLVNGASGGVGTFAVQLARAVGAEVTGVCGKRNLDLVRSLGAHEAIDYTTADFSRMAGRFDVVLDISGGRPVSALRRLLDRKGTFVAVGGPGGRWVQPADRMMAVMAMKSFVPQRMVVADLVRHGAKAVLLRELAGLIEAGKVTPVIDRTYPFGEIPTAVAYQEKGHATGKVVITI